MTAPAALAACLFGGAGCSDDAKAFAELSYRAACFSTGGCTETVRSFRGRDGALDGNEQSTRVRCSVIELSNSGTLVLDFAVTTSEYGLEMRNAVFPRGGGVASPGNTCEVVYTDLEVNRFRGACGPLNPQPIQPCRLDNLSVDEDSKVSPGGYTVNGTLLCNGLPLEADNLRTRELTRPGTSADPFAFRLVDCERRD